MKKIALIITVFIFALTGCASVTEKSKETKTIPAETTAIIDSPQASNNEPENETIENTKSNDNIETFSYEEVTQTHKRNDPGVIFDGFHNISEAEMSTQQQVIDRAKNECTIEYDAINIFYDSTADMWEVVFYTDGTLGSCQNVYLDSKGLTCLIVYGE